MRFMVMIKSNDRSERGVMSTEAELNAMNKYNEELVKAGVLLAGEGLHPSSRGARVKFTDGQPTVIDGYKRGDRDMYGMRLPDGLRDNEKLAEPIITPTSKAVHGSHDEPLSKAELLEQGLLTQAQWDTVSDYALRLFARGQQRATERGLILADTKYEFGTDKNGTIILADEIHTPDSSRYWIAASYEQALASGSRPESFDKDFIRSWVSARCDPYKDPIPEIPEEIVEQASRVYAQAYEAITGKEFSPDASGDSVLDRIRSNLERYF